MTFTPGDNLVIEYIADDGNTRYQFNPLTPASVIADTDLGMVYAFQRVADPTYVIWGPPAVFSSSMTYAAFVAAMAGLGVTNDDEIRG